MSEWVALTDEDRQQAFESLPGGLEGFLKHWGWLHFAKEIERRCMEKNRAEDDPGGWQERERVLYGSSTACD